MDWVDGTDLHRLIRGQPGALPEDRVLPWMRQACEGMLAVHDQGIVHRNLKPSNILVDARGIARVADFGLARAPATLGELSQSGAIMGTPHYMAPEQAEDPRRVDARADVYGFGATFYHALTGRPPFVGETAFAVLYNAKAEPLTAPRAMNPELSERTAEVIERCLAKEPADRFPSFAEVLRHFGPGSTPGSPWAAADDRDLAPYLTRYRARRDGYLAATGWNVELDAYTFPRGQSLRVVRGDIVAQQVDALVSSDNQLLQMRVGVSGAIAAAAGPAVAEAAARLAPVRPGRAAVTGGGDLEARLVLHAVTVGYVEGRPIRPSRDLIAELVASCFYLADSHGVLSIAFPLLGTGRMGFPVDVCLDVMFQALARAFIHSLTSIQDARIVLYDMPRHVDRSG
jgi:eukaryotic-like serine/threonine-protein kinase